MAENTVTFRNARFNHEDKEKKKEKKKGTNKKKKNREQKKFRTLNSG